MTLTDGFVPELIKKQGWYYIGICSLCRGKKKYKYNHKNYPGVELQWLVNSNLYHIVKNGKRIFTYINPFDLNHYLNTINEIDR